MNTPLQQKLYDTLKGAGRPLTGRELAQLLGRAERPRLYPHEVQALNVLAAEGALLKGSKTVGLVKLINTWQAV